MKNNIEWIKSRPIAHRGLHDVGNGVIENTFSAFASAIKHNYAIECDLQISSDGEAMIFHDDTLDRITKSSGAVKAMTAKQLQQVNFDSTDDKIQTLAQLLEQVNGQVSLVLELKTLRDGDISLAKRAIEVLSGYKGNVSLMSFAPNLVSAVKTFAPKIARGAVALPQSEEYWNIPALSSDPSVTYMDIIEPDFLSYDVRAFPSPFAQKFVADAKPVITWTIKSQEMADFASTYSDQITFEGFLPD